MFVGMHIELDLNVIGPIPNIRHVCDCVRLFVTLCSIREKMDMMEDSHRQGCGRSFV